MATRSALLRQIVGSTAFRVISGFSSEASVDVIDWTIVML